MKNYNLPVEGMTCASYVARVEKVIGKIDGVKNVTANFASEKVSFETDREDLDLNEVANAIEEYGYKLIIEKDKEDISTGEDDH